MSTYHLNVLVTLVAAAFLIIQSVSGQPDIVQSPEKRPVVMTVKKYCGTYLSDALKMACGGVYNTLFKKSVPGNSYQEAEMGDYPYAFDTSPFRRRENALMMMGRFGGGRFRRESRGVHDECCVKGCTYDELQTYCQE